MQQPVADVCYDDWVAEDRSPFAAALVGCEDVVEELAEFRRLRPDITLMDLRLPRVIGTDVLAAIRREYP